MTSKLAPLAILALALAGCSQTPVATVTSDPAPDPAKNMCTGLNIESCTDMLTSHVSNAYSAYRDLQSPTAGQTQAHDALNSLSSNWYEQCAQQDDAGNGWSYVANDPTCNRIAEAITGHVLEIDPTAGP